MAILAPRKPTDPHQYSTTQIKAWHESAWKAIQKKKLADKPGSVLGPLTDPRQSFL